jgi:hypothetical protein
MRNILLAAFLSLLAISAYAGLKAVAGGSGGGGGGLPNQSCTAGQYVTGANGTAFLCSSNVIFTNVVITPTSNQTLTIGNTVGNYLMTPATTLSALTVNLPASPTDGQIVTIATRSQITSLTMSGNGNTLNGTATGVFIAGGFMSWKYSSGGNWDRVG